MDTNKKVELLLRIGVAIAFIYPPISALMAPYSWVGYFPVFVSSIPSLDIMLLLHLFGALEIVIGVWILFAKRIFIPSFLAVILLFLIIAFNLNQMDVLFRDIPILLMAVALCIVHKK